jgi:AGCS family alanine or glycine:cation symporter
METAVNNVTFEGVVQAIDGFVWGWFLIVLILAVGVYLTIRTRCVQVRHLGLALKYMVKNEDDGVGEVSSFGALWTALSATIGTGNIVGVATAIVAGGPGALLWMLIAAFFGMATKYAEGLLAVKFRSQTAPGHFLGGPFCYIEKGLGKKWKPLAKLFAAFGAIAGLFGIGTMTQVNGIYEAAQNLFDREKQGLLFTVGGAEKPVLTVTWTTIIVSAVVTVCAALVIIGGIKRIAKVSEIVVPFMAGAYVLFALIIVISCYREIPAAVGLIFRSAFDPVAVGGAISGLLLKTVIQKGVGRGIFSNEAGLGSAPIAAASAKTKEPVRQGLVTMTGTFIDTIVICTITGLSIVVTGAWNTGSGIDGAKVTTYAWQYGLPFDPNVSAFILMVCLAFFAFTTILGWNYYGERCLEYLTGSKRAITVYRWVYIGAVFLGSYLALDAVWGIANIFNGLMALPNLVALFLLAGVVSKETKAYFGRIRFKK